MDILTFTKAIDKLGAVVLAIIEPFRSFPFRVLLGIIKSIWMLITSVRLSIRHGHRQARQAIEIDSGK